jgi:hypothetical protein
MWDVKGEERLKKFVQQDLLLGCDQRVLAENLAKGRGAIMTRLTYYSYVPLIKAGLPIKARHIRARRKFSSTGCSAAKGRRSHRERWVRRRGGRMSILSG